MDNRRPYITTVILITSGILAATLIISESTALVHSTHIGRIQPLYQWLGLLVVAGMLLHLHFHWRSFKKSITSRVAVFFIYGILFSGSAVALISTEKQAKSATQLVALYSEKPLKQIATFENRNIEELLIDFEIANISINSTEQNLIEIAQENETTPINLLNLIINQPESTTFWAIPHL